MPPTPPPLERLQVTDGLLLTADRWRVAHRYHRQRQDLHFQALYQPGIVTGLGVCPAVAPAQVANQYRDGRWLQVQPGVAIDHQGNPIVVPQPVDYRIAAQPIAEPLQVYLVLSFVDPDQLERATGTYVVQETFRLEEKNSPPDPQEIELCRILLQPGQSPLRLPPDPFTTAAHDLDFRHRPYIQPRPQHEVRLGYLTLTPQANLALEAALQGLTDALPGLYPQLQGHVNTTPLNLRSGSLGLTELQPYDLLYLSYHECQQLQTADLSLLQAYIAGGGLLWLEVPTQETAIAEIFQIWADMVKVLALPTAARENPTRYAALRREQAELERCMAVELPQIIPTLGALAGQREIGQPFEGQAMGDAPPPFGQVSEVAGIQPPPVALQPGLLPAHHPLRTQPFRFGLLPLIQNQPVALFNWGGVVVMVGDLSTAWGGDRAAFLPRDTIRPAQELGVNLLHFAHQRRRWAINSLSVTPAPPDLDTIYEQLNG